MPQTLNSFLCLLKHVLSFFPAVYRFVRMVDEGKPRDWEDIAFRLLGMYSFSSLFAQLSSKVTRTDGAATLFGVGWKREGFVSWSNKLP